MKTKEAISLVDSIKSLIDAKMQVAFSEGGLHYKSIEQVEKITEELVLAFEKINQRR